MLYQGFYKTLKSKDKLSNMVVTDIYVKDRKKLHISVC